MSGTGSQLLERLSKASVAIIVLGILASVAAGVFTTDMVSKNSRLSQEVATDRSIKFLQTSIQLAEARLQAISGFFAMDRTVTPTEFDTFVARLGKQSIVNELQFVRIVPDAELQQYIVDQRRLRPGFTIFDNTGSREEGLTPTTGRDVHYINEFIWPLEGNEAAVGLDVATNPILLRAFKKAMSNQQTVVTDSLTLVQNRGILALLMVTPTYRLRDVSKSITGFAAGLITMDRIGNAVTNDQAVLLSIQNQTTGHDLMPAKATPAGYTNTSGTVTLPGNMNWQVNIATRSQGSPQAAGLLVFGLGALLTLLVLASLEQSRLQASNLKFGARLTASEYSLTAREAAYRGLFDNASTANVEVDVQSGEIVRANQAMTEITGLGLEELVGSPAIELIDVRDRASLTSALTSKLTITEGLPGIELRLELKNDDTTWVLASIGESSEAVSGRPSACIVMQDISDRKKADDARNYLVRELAHRVRNTMQLLGSLADQTAETSSDVPSFVRNFKGRLLALNSAQDALFDANWGPVRVDLLAPRILEPFETEDGRQVIHTEIEKLTLLPQEAQTIALALHELANNASRHGALKSFGGRVDLTIKSHNGSGDAKEADRVLNLTWIEHGGDQTVSSPETSGFGSIMLERLLARQHGGESRFCWDPQGLRFEASLPLADSEGFCTDRKY